ncbi:hypothetical protein MCOR27_006733 [Pyricularia oryzae]|uniref:Uncharacterized protein n=1 Tax=Pyricularia grisea TaxID=148305 RepID=A0ABQ8NYD5_PYRGI|nr:hypothetical protein MCOR19_007616 [Pyricularia oryzae]KAI6303916.1 hypothetical protein MCOR33_001085 [Pyricularia grisea]KAI6274649.1 hypothetical protein MCOR26_006401 [Pyricularia oryzae]KAI6275956.1 hypothetical protein MCOR27_006733 [Pyricularia oryzae]KAI6340667.1 hypothetical protein MCOR30_002475 [Pyricularia oryzae]
MLRLIRQAAFSADTARRSLGDLADPVLRRCSGGLSAVGYGDDIGLPNETALLWRKAWAAPLGMNKKPQLADANIYVRALDHPSPSA